MTGARPPTIRICPWRALGLQNNPFRRLHGIDLVRSLLPGDGTAEGPCVDRWLDEPCAVLQFVGEEGWGKSTHLRACHTVAEAERGIAARFDYVPLGTTRLKVPPRSAEQHQHAGPGLQMWFIDEANRLRPRVRRRLAHWAVRNQVRLFLGTHHDLAADMRAGGPTVRTIALAPADESTIRQFIARRATLAAAEPNTHLGLQVTEEAIRRLNQDARGNLARVEYVLYEAAQTAVERPGVAVMPLLIDDQAVERAIQRIYAVSAS